MNHVPVFNVDGRITTEGLIQRRDPRLRVAMAALFAIVVVSLHSLDRLGILLGLAVVLGLAARLPLGPTLRRMAAMEAFMAAVLLPLPLFAEGTQTFPTRPPAASWEGAPCAAQINF